MLLGWTVVAKAADLARISFDALLYILYRSDIIS
jgi:hypothetical protein